MPQQPDITVYFLQASRSIRTVWLLEELNLPYKLEFADRQNQKAPQEFKDASGNPLGKFPSIKDGDLTVHESGAITECVLLLRFPFLCIVLACHILALSFSHGTSTRDVPRIHATSHEQAADTQQTRYICDNYDAAHKMIPTDRALRAKTQTFIHAAEGTLALHALAVLYFRWNVPATLREANPDAIAEAEAKLSVNVQKDMDWLEGALASSGGPFLVGKEVTAADVMMAFSAQFTIARGLGTQGRKWPGVDAWLERCEGLEAYKRAVARSGHTLYPKTT